MGFGKGALLWLLGIPLPIIILARAVLALAAGFPATEKASAQAGAFSA